MIIFLFHIIVIYFDLVSNKKRFTLTFNLE